MANLTTAYPMRTGDLQKDYEALYDWAVGLLDELKPLVNNLDAGNVAEAGSVRAENINTNHAKIKDGQVQSLTADKLTAGTIDADEIQVIHLNADNITAGTLTVGQQVDIQNEEGTLKINGSEISMMDQDGNPRIQFGADADGQYLFLLQNSNGSQGLYLLDDGNIVFSGSIDTGKDAWIGNRLYLDGTNGLAGIVWKNGERKICDMFVENDCLHITGVGNMRLNGKSIATQEGNNGG
jgi:hypothetical protein|nr:MAG TPA: hypothetical protein [Caudoviricetes sp.]